MTHKQAGLLIFHGALLLFIGNLVGFIFANAIVENWGADAERAWRVAHTSLVLGGIIYVAIGAARNHIALSQRLNSFLVRALIGTAYVFPAALILGANIGARGLSEDGPPLHVFVFACFVVSVLALIATSALFLWGTYRGLSHEDA